MGRLVQLQRNKAMASSYQCQSCPCGASYNSLFTSPTSGTNIPPNDIPYIANECDMDCNGVPYFYDITTLSSWSTSNASVCTVNDSIQKGLATVVAQGTATITATHQGIVRLWDGFICHYSLVYKSGTSTCRTPTMTCPIATRGSSVTCSIRDFPSGATTSEWKFTDGGTIVTPGVNPGTSWTGKVVKSGIVSVKVTKGTNNQPLNWPLVVTARSGWAFTAASAQKVPNGSALCGDSPTVTTLASPPVANQNNEAPLAKFCVTVAYSFQTDPVNGGPNSGYKYVTSVIGTSPSPANIPTTFKWLRVPDLDSPTSTFYQAQCGNYNSSTNPNGFISGANLDSQTTRHEAGATASHLDNYEGAQDNSTNNLGTNAEGQTGTPSTSTGDFVIQVQNALDPKKSAITSAAASENIPGVNYSSSGNLLGYVNYQPYASCQ